MVNAAMTFNRLAVLLLGDEGRFDRGSSLAVVVFQWGEVVVVAVDDLTAQFF